MARLGGDEFAIVQLDGEQPSAAEALAAAWSQAIAAPFDIAGQQVHGRHQHRHRAGAPATASTRTNC